MATAISRLHLRPAQREFLESRAKVNGTSPSAEARSAINLYQAVTLLGDLELLDLATRPTKGELELVIATLDAGMRRAELFFAQIEANDCPR